MVRRVGQVVVGEVRMTWQRLILVTAGAGMALGIGTKLADNQENALSWLGSLAAPWLLVSFALGSVSNNRFQAVASATGAMLAGVVIYYGWMRAFEGGANLAYVTSHTILWLLLAPIAGVVFGLAGWIWRRSGSHWMLSLLAVAFPGGVVAGESGFMALTAYTLTSAEITLLSLWVTTGLLMPFVLLKGRALKLAGMAMTAGFVLIGLAMIPTMRSLMQGLRSLTG
jgi:hypothetical protein